VNANEQRERLVSICTGLPEATFDAGDRTSVSRCAVGRSPTSSTTTMATAGAHTWWAVKSAATRQLRNFLCRIPDCMKSILRAILVQANSGGKKCPGAEGVLLPR
jgi:hypothetical protein